MTHSELVFYQFYERFNSLLKVAEYEMGDLLFNDWGEFMILLPDEKIVEVYNSVRATSEYDLQRNQDFSHYLNGDLILTNRRLIHLAYRYKLDSRGAKIGYVAFSLGLLLLLPSLFFFLFLPWLILLVLLLFVVSWILLKGKLQPVGYKQTTFEIPLEKIGEAIEPSSELSYASLK